MVWNAARVFHGRKPNWPGLLVGALAWAAAVTLLDPAASMLRMIVGAGIVSVYAALTASELWVERRKSLQRRWPAFVVPVLHGCVLMLPIVLGSFLRPERCRLLRQHLGHRVCGRAHPLCRRHRVRDLHAGVGAHGDRAPDRRVHRSPDRHAQPPRLLGSLRARDRAREPRPAVPRP